MVQFHSIAKPVVDKERILFLSVFAVLCVCCLFGDGLPLLDSNIRSKWLGMLFSTATIGLLVPFIHRRGILTLCLSDVVFFLLIFYIAVRSLERSSVLFGLQMSSIVLLYVSFRMIGRIYIRDVFAIVAALTLILSLWGICQSFHILPSHSQCFPATGNFDNPAGFASALILGFPAIVYSWKSENRGWRVVGYISASLIAFAIVLSKSRAGIVSVSLVLLWSCTFSVRNIPRCRKAILTFTLLLAIVATLYFLKRDSADGRLLIWIVSLRLISKFLFFGGGTGAFGALYMPEQANYFRLHPNSRFAMLADNVGHPLNEYLSIVLQWGLLGLMLITLLIFLIIKAWLKNRSKETDTLFLILLSLGSFSFFSYPMSYPFGWVMLVFCISNLAILTEGIIKMKKPLLIEKSIVVFLSLFLIVGTFFCLINYMQWFEVNNRSSLTSKTLDVKYHCLYQKLKRDPTFLYNYAASLYGERANERAERIMKECLLFRTDYSTLLLLGNIYITKGEDDNAKKIYKEMSEMCPNRFLPLYELFLIADRKGQRDEAISLCETILEKEIKINSDKVQFIKTRCFNYLKEQSLIIK